MTTNLHPHRILKNCSIAAALVLLLAVLLPGSSALAGGSDNPWMIGLDFLANNIGEDDDDNDLLIEESGAGAALQFGYLFTTSFQLRFYGSGAVHETSDPDVDIVFSGGLIEAVYLFRPEQNFRPYLFGGLGAYRLESSEDEFTYSAEGPGASFGGGMYYFVNPHVSFHTSARLEAVNWDKLKMSIDTGLGTIEGEFPIDESGSAAKFTAGMAFWF